MRRHLIGVFFLLAVSMLFISAAQAEIQASAGADFRLRQEIWDDVVTLDTTKSGSGADRSFLRFRTRVWGQVDFSKDFDSYLRLTNEAKWYGFGPFKAFKTNPNNDDLDPDELVFDNLYADAKNLFGAVDLRIGRQDFIGTYGEGFLLMDGTPNDGSRTWYFNAAKMNVKVSQNFNFDLTYITDPKTDIYMPSIHPAVSGTSFSDNKKILNVSNEQAFVLYGRGKIGNLLLEPYYIYKTEQTFIPPGAAHVPKLNLNNVGARVVYAFDSWKLGGEFVYQFGSYDTTSEPATYNGVDRRGYGGYVFVGRKYDAISLKPEFDLRYVYLSGDNPNTSKNEAFDPLFSRNPNWNELLIYTLINETLKLGGPIPGYWTNMEIIKATVKLNFSPATNLAVAYQYLWAPDSTTGLNPAMFSNGGHSRGHLPTAILSHKFTKNLDGMLQLEYFMPKNFYASKDPATFFRWQLNYKL